ncbi:MAG TPA: hypothetical protein VEA41_04985 [Salinarimonas sp.]|jgi:hypothetical protein|nr:hypothetical protein [Salinarimonas sp.]
MSEHADPADAAGVADARRREMAVEHILFNSLRFIARRHPELLDELEGSLDHLWDHADDGTRDDEALRTIARKFLKSLRAES